MGPPQRVSGRRRPHPHRRRDPRRRRGGGEFNWTIRWEFSDDIPPSLTLADVAGLHVDSGGPASVIDADANWIVLLYHTDAGPDAAWLVSPGGSPLFVPGQTGTVEGP